MSATVICRPLPEPAGAPDVESEDLLQLVTRNTPVARSKAVSLVKVMQIRDSSSTSARTVERTFGQGRQVRLDEAGLGLGGHQPVARVKQEQRPFGKKLGL